jgi:hypothetical protein
MGVEGAIYQQLRKLRLGGQPELLRHQQRSRRDQY